MTIFGAAMSSFVHIDKILIILNEEAKYKIMVRLIIKYQTLIKYRLNH